MKLIKYLFIFIILSSTPSMSENPTGFNTWKNSFKKTAIENNISEKTFDIVMADIKFLPDVIKYDRYQPEFYEDTKTYISKRTSSKKVSKGIDFYKKNSKFNKHSRKFI
jgi:membrane-bound lytic murein transglycosylase B